MFSAADHARVADAIKAAEAGTRAQIVCVFARGSSAYAQVAALWAAAAALAAPWPMIAFTGWSVQRIFLAQLAVFVVALALFSWEPLRLRLVPRPLMRLRAHREAMAQFFARGLTRTKNRCGLMIFVSRAERYARIVVDEGLGGVPRETWQGAIDALVAAMREDAVADGFVAAIARCGAVLAEVAPPDGARDDLPDRLYVI